MRYGVTHNIQSRSFQIFALKGAFDGLNCQPAFLTILLLLPFHFLQAQSFKERLEHIQSAYTGMDTMQVKMTVEVYEGESEHSPYFKEEADIRKQAENFSYQFGATQLLMNEHCLVMIDKTSREIIYTKRSPEEEKNFFKDPFRVSMDSILSLYESPQFLGHEAEGDHYRVFQKKGEIHQVDIFLHREEDWLRRIEYRYQDKHYVVIRFTLFDRHAAFDNNTFSEARYLKFENGTWKPAAGFSGYHVSVSGGQEEQ